MWNSWEASVASCIPGRLAYYHDIDEQSYLILQRASSGYCPCACASSARSRQLGIAASPRDRRDEEEQHRRGRGAEEPGGETASGR